MDAPYATRAASPGYTPGVSALGELRQWAGLVVGATVLAVAAFKAEPCDRFAGSPLVWVAAAVGAATVAAALAEPDQRGRAAAFAGVVVAVAGVILLIVVFGSAECTGE